MGGFCSIVSVTGVILSRGFAFFGAGGSFTPGDKPPPKRPAEPGPPMRILSAPLHSHSAGEHWRGSARNRRRRGFRGFPVASSRSGKQNKSVADLPAYLPRKAAPRGAGAAVIDARAAAIGTVSLVSCALPAIACADVNSASPGGTARALSMQRRKRHQGRDCSAQACRQDSSPPVSRICRCHGRKIPPARPLPARLYYLCCLRNPIPVYSKAGRCLSTANRRTCIHTFRSSAEPCCSGSRASFAPAREGKGLRGASRSSP